MSLEINGTLILAGDFNIYLLHCDNNSLVADFIDCIYSNLLFPKVNYPTRITTNTASLIGNIFINNSLLNLTGLLASDISDHIPIFCFYHSSDRNRQKQLTELPKSFYKHINFFKVNQKLTAINWDFITLYFLVDDDYNEMLNIIRNVINSNFSLIKHKPKSATKQPWLTTGLKNHFRVKNKMYYDMLYKRCTLNEYKKYRNKLNSLLRIAKRNYCQEFVNRHKQNSKALWNMINLSLNRKFTKNRSNISKSPDELHNFFF